MARVTPSAGCAFQAPAPEAVDAFGKALAAAGVTVSVRRSRGRDILAVCGQLHLKKGAPAPAPALP